MNTSLLLALILLGCNRSNQPEAEVCSADAIELSADGFGVTSLPTTMAWSDTAGVSVGEVFELALPPDVVSFSATVDLPGANTGFGLVSFNEQVWIDAEATGASAWDTAPYAHWAALGGTVVAPVHAGTVPETGCLRLQAAALDDQSGKEATLHLVLRTDVSTDPVIDINIVVMGDTELYGDDLTDALDVVSAAWSSGGGPTVGTVDVVQLEGDTYLPYDDSNALRSTVVNADRPRAVNVFVVQDYANGAGYFGEAGGIPGPVGLQGLDAAGVIVALDAHKTTSGSVDTQLFGEVLAHEIGHQLGLFHTTESDGSRSEALSDTPECPASADANGDGSWSAAECRDWDGANFMFWVSGNYTQDEVSQEQGLVLALSPVARSSEGGL